MKIFLEDNKIFFDTIATVSFSIMTIILSIVSIYVAMQANKIATKQVEIDKSEKMPFFTINSITERIEESCKYKKYKITNIGGKINNALLIPIISVQIQINKNSIYNFETEEFDTVSEHYYNIEQNGFEIEINNRLSDKINSKIQDKIIQHKSCLPVFVELLFDIFYIDFQGKEQHERYILSNNNLIRTEIHQKYTYSEHNPFCTYCYSSIDKHIDEWTDSIIDKIFKE